jgi:hypothetical protein
MTEKYHGMEIPKLVNSVRDWTSQDDYDRYIDLKAKHDDLISLTDYQLGNYCDRHPQAA